MSDSEELNTSEGTLGVSIMDFGLYFTSLVGCIDDLVMENLDRVGETVSSFSCSNEGCCVLGDLMGDGKSSSVSVTLLSRLSILLSDFNGSKDRWGEYLDL